MNKDAVTRFKKTSLTIFLPLTLLQASRKGCWRVACERMLETEHKLHILTPLLWPSRCVLFSWCWGPLHRSLPKALSDGCGFHYHIWSLLSGTLLITASGVSEVPLGRVWPSLPHLVSNPLGVCWHLHRGFPRSPSVGCGLPYHISSLTLWESAGDFIRGFPSAPSVGCGLPYHISSLTLWESAGNCIRGFRGPSRSGVAFPTTSGL